MKNYWKMNALSLLSVPYLYIDHKSYLADPIFEHQQIRVKFKEELHSKENPYCIIFCKIRKKDTERFEEALERLKNKMLLMGHRDYPEICEKITAMIDEGLKERNTI